MPRLKDIATALNTSPTTVSNVLSGKGRVSPDLASRVREEACRLGYAPGGAGRALKTGRSGVIGLIVPDLGHPLFPRMTQAIEHAATQAGYGMLIADSHGDGAAQTEAIGRLFGRGADGVVLIPRRGTPLPPARERIVVIDTPSTVGNTVSADHHAGGAGVARHLESLGHRKLVFFGETALSPVQADRVEGMQSALGPDTRSCVVWQDRAGTAAVLRAVQSGATAVACTSDLLALALLGPLQSKGLAVPARVSLTGFDDLLFAEVMHPGLTTMAADQSAIADHAVGTLRALIEGAPALPPRTVPMTLISRASTHPTNQQEKTTC